MRARELRGEPYSGYNNGPGVNCIVNGLDGGCGDLIKELVTGSTTALFPAGAGQAAANATSTFAGVLELPIGEETVSAGGLHQYEPNSG